MVFSTRRGDNFNMNSELESPALEIAQVARDLMDTFLNRRDLYARQLEDGSYVCIRKPLTERHIIAHLKGDITLGAYSLDQDSLARFVTLDGDDDNQFQSLTKMHLSLRSDGIPCYLESSRRGGHLWLFLPQPTSGNIARSFGISLAQRFGLTGIEVFPKQARLSGGPGSLIRLPFGIHRKTGQRYDFVNPDLSAITKDWIDQIRMLTNPDTVPDDFINQAIIRKQELSVPKLNTKTISPENLTLSTRIKASISVYDFVSQYVELNPGGHGLCPFHPDTKRSFAVHSDGNYWNCFAGCGGGSIIDFWMKYRDCDFTTSVRELATFLLNSD
jgi:hypothetical protein